MPIPKRIYSEDKRKPAIMAALKKVSGCTKVTCVMEHQITPGHVEYSGRCFELGTNKKFISRGQFFVKATDVFKTLPDPRGLAEDEARAMAIGKRFFGYQDLFALRSVKDLQQMVKSLAERHPEDTVMIYSLAAMIQNRVTVDILVHQMNEKPMELSNGH